MVTGFERDIWKDMSKIERHLKRIAISQEYQTRVALSQMTAQTVDGRVAVGKQLLEEYEELMGRA